MNYSLWILKLKMNLNYLWKITKKRSLNFADKLQTIKLFYFIIFILDLLFKYKKVN